MGSCCQDNRFRLAVWKLVFPLLWVMSSILNNELIFIALYRTNINLSHSIIKNYVTAKIYNNTIIHTNTLIFEFGVRHDNRAGRRYRLS